MDFGKNLNCVRLSNNTSLLKSLCPRRLSIGKSAWLYLPSRKPGNLYVCNMAVIEIFLKHSV